MDEIVKKVEKCIIYKDTNMKGYKKYGDENRKLFLKYFTIGKYIEGYLAKMNNL